MSETGGGELGPIVPGAEALRQDTGYPIRSGSARGPRI